MISPLQYCKLHIKGNESTQEWMGRLCIKATECNYKECDRHFKEQFIKSIDDEKTVQKITEELTAPQNTQEIDNEQVLTWAQRWKHKGCRKKHQINEKYKRL